MDVTNFVLCDGIPTGSTFFISGRRKTMNYVRSDGQMNYLNPKAELCIESPSRNVSMSHQEPSLDSGVLFFLPLPLSCLSLEVDTNVLI